MRRRLRQRQRRQRQLDASILVHEGRHLEALELDVDAVAASAARADKNIELGLEVVDVARVELEEALAAQPLGDLLLHLLLVRHGVAKQIQLERDEEALRHELPKAP